MSGLRRKKPLKRTPLHRTGPRARERATKARRLKSEERANKMLARMRDGHVCRFPLCGCRRPLEVSHRFHKGMGGDPTGVRSRPEFLMTLCDERHKGKRFSIDSENVAWLPLTPDGANGPVRWFLSLDALEDAERRNRLRLPFSIASIWRDPFRSTIRGRFFLEVARETYHGEDEFVRCWEPFEPWQRRLLEELAACRL